MDLRYEAQLQTRRFQAPVFVGSGFAALRRPGMTANTEKD